jgi:hypothetical protein
MQIDPRWPYAQGAKEFLLERWRKRVAEKIAIYHMRNSETGVTSQVEAEK